MPNNVPTTALSLVEKIRHIQGPILVIGASGFVGANLMRSMMAVRGDVYGTTTGTVTVPGSYLGNGYSVYVYTENDGGGRPTTTSVTPLAGSPTSFPVACCSRQLPRSRAARSLRPPGSR